MNSPQKKTNLTKLLGIAEQLITKPKWHKTISAQQEELSARLKTVHSETRAIKASLETNDKDLTALDLSLRGVQKKHKAIVKDLQKIQKRFSKKRVEIQTKLLTPLTTVEETSKILADATRGYVKQIEEIVKNLREKLETDEKLVNECENILRPISHTLAKMLLTKTMEGCATTLVDLKERLESIVKSTSDMTQEDTPPQFNAVVVNTSLTKLREHCASNVKLLDLVDINIKKAFPDPDNKKEKKEEQEKSATSLGK